MKLVILSLADPVGDPTSLRSDLLALAWLLAEQIRAAGRQRKLKDMTINRPADLAAISVIELACQALSQGEFSAESAELDRLLDRLTADPVIAGRLGPAMSSLAGRLLPGGFL